LNSENPIDDGGINDKDVIDNNQNNQPPMFLDMIETNLNQRKDVRPLKLR